MENNQAQGTTIIGMEYYVYVGWDWCQIDIDCSAVLEGDGVSELVYYGNQKDRAESIRLMGGFYQRSDDWGFHIHLDRVSAQYNRLVFVFTIYNPHVNSFGSVSGMYLNVYNADNDEKLVEYRLDGDYSQYCSLVVGEMHRVGSGWEFLSIGEGTNIKDLEPLRDYVVGKHW